MLCQCPLNKSLPDIPEEGCPENFGQIQKIIFQRLYADDFKCTININPEGSSGSTLEDIWAKAIQGSDFNQFIISPYVQSVTTEGGDAVTFGGGGESIDGIAEVVRTNATTFKGMLRSLSQVTIKALRQLQCFAEIGNLGVYFLDGNCRIMGKYESTFNIEPIPISSLFFGDKNFGGLDEPDSNSISFMMEEGWDENLRVASLPFNPLTTFEYLKAPKVKNVSEINEGSPASEQPTEGVGGEPRRKTAENK